MRVIFVVPIAVLVLFSIASINSFAIEPAATESVSSRPNIVVIMADDMGYGDVQRLNPVSTVATPSLNKLAGEGVTFTDAHSPSGVCTPTRYGLICGRYCWRTRLKNGVLGGYSKPLVDLEQQTIASVLGASGYKTACIGKWHLGLGWQWQEDLPANINYFGIAGNPGSVDFSKPITDAPTDHGFDYSYIIPASLDMSPYVYIENNRVTSIPDKVIEGDSFPAFYRKGEIAADFKIIECLDHLTDKAVEFVTKNAKGQQPFFLYLPLPAPHKPVMPTTAFQGKSKLGFYADFVMQVDNAVGQVLESLDRNGVRENTVVIFTSDNGSFMYRFEDGKPDHLDEPKQQGYRPENHQPNGNLRGTKADIWEGGHRVPFFVRWPDKVKTPHQISQTITHTDILATLAEIANAKFDAIASPDSYSFLPQVLQSDAASLRPPVIHHSAGGMFAIRKGKWKLVLGNGSGGRQKPKGKKFAKPYHLFDISADLGENVNLIEQYPEVAEELERQFEQIADGNQLTTKQSE